MMRTFLVCAIGCLSAVTTTRAATVAYWRFEEGKADSPAGGYFSVLDSSGNGLDGTAINGPVYRADVANHVVPYTADPNTLSLQFNGTSQRIMIPDNSKFVLTHSLTLEAYIKPLAASNVGQIVFRGDDRSGFDAYWLYVQNNNVIFDIENAAQQFAYVIAPLPSLNTWMDVAGTLDDKTGAMRIYINGIQRASAVTSVRPMGPMDPNASPGIGIGNTQSGNYSEYFDGLIDEVRISDVALAPSQLLFASSVPGDADRDNSVGFDDLVMLASHYGTQSGGVWETGDFNGDGKVNFQDLVILAAHYAAGAQGGAAGPALTSVPEPTASVCMLAALLAAPLVLRGRAPDAALVSPWST